MCQVTHFSVTLQWLAISLWVGVRGAQSWHYTPTSAGVSSWASSPTTCPPAPMVPTMLLIPLPFLACQLHSSLKDFALAVPLSEMGFTQAPMRLAHSLTYLRSLLKCHFLKLFKLETSSKLPFSLPWLSFSQWHDCVYLPTYFILFCLPPSSTGI